MREMVLASSVVGSSIVNTVKGGGRKLRDDLVDNWDIVWWHAILRGLLSKHYSANPEMVSATGSVNDSYEDSSGDAFCQFSDVSREHSFDLIAIESTWLQMSRHTWMKHVNSPVCRYQYQLSIQDHEAKCTVRTSYWNSNRLFQIVSDHSKKQPMMMVTCLDTNATGL